MVKQQWGCIYRLTNTINGKKYIGKTVNFKSRMRDHKNSKDAFYVHRAIRKYGWNTFKKEIIIDDIPEEDLSNMEVCYIAVENTKKPNGYNLTDGGEGTSGHKHTEEWKKKQSERMAGFKHTEESRKKMSEIRKLALSNRHQFGTIHFHKKNKKWRVRSTRPKANPKKSKNIGIYLTKEQAIEALNHYNLTGKCMPSNRCIRKRGTGSIKKKHNGKYRARYSRNKIYREKQFDTIEECENWLKIMYNN